MNKRITTFVESLVGQKFGAFQFEKLDGSFSLSKKNKKGDYILSVGINLDFEETTVSVIAFDYVTEWEIDEEHFPYFLPSNEDELNEFKSNYLILLNTIANYYSKYTASKDTRIGENISDWQIF
jgi:hypothetical protein